MEVNFLLTILWLAISIVCQIISAHMWGMSKQLVVDPTRICRKVKRLRGRQANICKNESDIIKEIIKGAQSGTRECQYQFRDRKWNCSTTSKKSIRKILLKDSRESGFVNAITSAGIVYEISQACSHGLLLDCSCDRVKSSQLNDKFDWRGCSDNINFGYAKAKEFIDGGINKRSDFKKLILQHNYEAGRLAVKNYMRTVCKCHGMSGSCSFKTCWKKLPLFRDVGNNLKEKFDGAIQVMAGNDGKGFITEDNTIKPPGREDIIYSESSPDFCETNRETGSLGTRGRICNETLGTDGCDLLCCGRGFTTSVKTETFNCRCKFEWCCNVICDTCKVRRKVHTCL